MDHQANARAANCAAVTRKTAQTKNSLTPSDVSLCRLPLLPAEPHSNTADSHFLQTNSNVFPHKGEAGASVVCRKQTVKGFSRATRRTQQLWVGGAARGAPLLAAPARPPNKEVRDRNISTFIVAASPTPLMTGCHFSTIQGKRHREFCLWVIASVEELLLNPIEA